MSPEQIAGQRVDIRSDLFAVGAVLFQALTGVKPFDADSMAGLVYQIMNVDPMSVTSAETTLPPQVARFIKKALSKDPEDRFETPAAMSRELLRLVRDGADDAEIDVATVIVRKGRGEDYQETIQKQPATGESGKLSSLGALPESPRSIPRPILPDPHTPHGTCGKLSGFWFRCWFYSCLYRCFIYSGISLTEDPGIKE